MKKALFLFSLLFCLKAQAAQQVKYVQISTGVLQPGTTAGFHVSSGTVINLNVPTFVSTGSARISSSTVTNYFKYTGTTAVFGYGPVFYATATPVAGGGLTNAQRYYWKVYPVGDYGQVGTPSGADQATLVTGGGNLSAQITWSLTEGASYYKITRHTTSGSILGYSTSSTVSGGFGVFIDTGGTITSGNPWSGNIGSTVAYFNGAIVLPGSSGGIYFWDYNKGRPVGYIQQTSANELFMFPGSGGDFPSIAFGDQFERQMISFQRGTNQSSLLTSTSSTKIIAYDGSATTGNMWFIAKSSVVINPFAADNTSKNWVFNRTGLETGWGDQIAFVNNAGDAGSAIRNRGPTGERWMELFFNTNFTISNNGTENVFALTASSTVLKATTIATEANANTYGFFQSSQTSSRRVSSSASGQFFNVVSTTLAQGVWMIGGTSCGNANGATVSQMAVSISSYSANTTTDHVLGANWLAAKPPDATDDNCQTVSPYEIKLDAPTTMYLKNNLTYTVATPRAYGTLNFWRNR